MRKLGVLLIAITACNADPVATIQRPKTPVGSRKDWTAEAPSSFEYYSDQYPLAVDNDVDLQDDVPVSASGYACPAFIVGAMIPGTIYPFHTTFVGRVWSPLPLIARTGFSNTGIPKAKYAVVNGPWVSEDGLIAVADGYVEGWCLFTPTRFRIATGQLHVFHFEGAVLEAGPSSGGGGACQSVEETAYDPYAHYGEVQLSRCPSGGGGGHTATGEPSGTVYQVGDLTGGETVDWQTGIGNGGISVCGSRAEVQAICIDIYNEETHQWQEWSCGYATVC